MKNKTYLKLFLVMLLNMCWVPVQAQTLHELVLTVDMSQQPNGEVNSSFSTGNKTTVVENSAVDRFTIWAEVGDTVLWKARTSGEAEVPVAIISVNYMSGQRIFSSNTLTGNNTVKATIIRGGKEDYVYRLQYSLGSDSMVYAVTSIIKTKK